MAFDWSNIVDAGKPKGLTILFWELGEKRIMRVYLVCFIVAFMIGYAWKDWVKSMCGLILMMAFMFEEEVPNSMFGIQGFNLWNLFFVGLFFAWSYARSRERLKWDMPQHITTLLFLYLGVIVVGVLRAVFDRNHIESYSIISLISEELINSVKWVLPGLMIFIGCRSRKQVTWILLSIVGLYFLIGLQTVRYLPWSYALNVGDEQALYVLNKRCRAIGYSTCDLSPMLAGAFWSIYAILPILQRKIYQIIAIFASGVVLFGMALTGGRAGYIAWGAAGLLLCMIKWRKYLLLAPVVLIVLPMVFPGAVDRLLTGIGVDDVTGQSELDDYAATSGRTVIWPYVIEKIGESPVIGYGRLAMRRTGIADKVMTELGESFPHPHNMYLELLLDNGIVGAIPILLFFAIVVVYSARLFRDKDILCSSVGGVVLSLLLVEFVAGLAAQHFYPREGAFGRWCAILLSLRVYIEWKRAKKQDLYFASQARKGNKHS